MHVGGRTVAQAEHKSVHVIILHSAGQTQDANSRQPAAGQKDKIRVVLGEIGKRHCCGAQNNATGPSLLLNTCKKWQRRPPSSAPSLQSLLGTHNLGRVHYEPIKDRHGNVLLVTIRDLDSQHSLYNGKWMQVTKLQSQRKSLSTPEEPYALDILIITIQVGIGGQFIRL